MIAFVEKIIEFLVLDGIISPDEAKKTLDEYALVEGEKVA